MNPVTSVDGDQTGLKTLDLSLFFFLNASEGMEANQSWFFDFCHTFVFVY